MKKIFVQIVDTMHGIHQSGMIEEPVKEGFEVANAVKHFGIVYGEISWEEKVLENNLANSFTIMRGRVDNAYKIINVIVL